MDKKKFYKGLQGSLLTFVKNFFDFTESKKLLAYKKNVYAYFLKIYIYIAYPNYAPVIFQLLSLHLNQHKMWPCSVLSKIAEQR